MKDPSLLEPVFRVGHDEIQIAVNHNMSTFPHLENRKTVIIIDSHEVVILFQALDKVIYMYYLIKPYNKPLRQEVYCPTLQVR